MRYIVDSGARRLVPDYAVPDAICVPLWNIDVHATLLSIAKVASQEIGVILLGPDPLGASAQIAEMSDPDHVAVVAGVLNSPWIRDHAPIAVQTEVGIDLVRPRHSVEKRPDDAELFANILPAASTTTDAWIASGNLVPGPDGLAVSTFSLLAKNEITSEEDLRNTLRADAKRLGIRDWLFVPGFPEDVSQHTDGMVRFLGPELCAVAMHSEETSSKISDFLVEQLAECLPDAEILQIPVSDGPKGFTSPLNWIQLDDHLLVPDFEDAPGLTPEGQAMLEARGFRITFVPSATAGLGGALRCLTAAIFS
ncbi:agmatine deiminase family protein [Roseovarius aestuariivivens]|uniref:agmatine deiminase family protein n=1 Tax=Roseovarius aestuariivivens TaxID=1888910 RepID=UPI00143693D0|nr:agmatine deiminase family protein [Roseovarius aestuariivivens]